MPNKNTDIGRSKKNNGQALCARDAAIKAAVTSPEMLASTVAPATAAIALKLLETYEAEVSLKTNDALAQLLVATDAKGKSTALDLMKKALRRRLNILFNFSKL